MTRLLPAACAGLVLALAGAAVAGLAASGGGASTYTYRATMSARAAVPPAKAPAGAAGTFGATVTENGDVRSLRWTLTFRRLSGKAVAAHVHLGRPGVAGGVLVALCGPCRSGQTGRAQLSRSAAEALERGRAYVNVHTSKSPAGEIRGQLRLTGKTATPGGTGSTGGTVSTGDTGTGGTVTEPPY